MINPTTYDWVQIILILVIVIYLMLDRYWRDE